MALDFTIVHLEYSDGQLETDNSISFVNILENRANIVIEFYRVD